MHAIWRASLTRGRCQATVNYADCGPKAPLIWPWIEHRPQNNRVFTCRKYRSRAVTGVIVLGISAYAAIHNQYDTRSTLSGYHVTQRANAYVTCHMGRCSNVSWPLRCSLLVENVLTYASCTHDAQQLTKEEAAAQVSRARILPALCAQGESIRQRSSLLL